jgi:hypothetical protein
MIALTVNSGGRYSFHAGLTIMGRKKLSSGLLFTLLVLIFFVFFVYEARNWRLQARLYPWTIGIPMVLLAVIQLVRDLKGSRQQEAEATPMDYRFSQTIDETEARRRTLNIFAWIFGFFVGVWLLGFSLAVPLLVFCYLKIQAEEGWVLSTLLTAVAWLLFWGLFQRLLRLPFPEGQVFGWIDLWQSAML